MCYADYCLQTYLSLHGAEVLPSPAISTHVLPATLTVTHPEPLPSCELMKSRFSPDHAFMLLAIVLTWFPTTTGICLSLYSRRGLHQNRQIGITCSNNFSLGLYMWTHWTVVRSRRSTCKYQWNHVICIWLFVSGLFHLIKYSQGFSMPWLCANWGSFICTLTFSLHVIACDSIQFWH